MTWAHVVDGSEPAALPDPDPPVEPDPPVVVDPGSDEPVTVEPVDPLDDPIVIDDPLQDPVSEIDDADEVPEATTEVEDPIDDVTEPESTTPNYQSVRVRLRFRFTESLRQILDVFHTPDDSDLVSRVNYRLSSNLRFAARFNSAGGGGLELPALDSTV